MVWGKFMALVPHGSTRLTNHRLAQKCALHDDHQGETAGRKGRQFVQQGLPAIPPLPGSFAAFDFSQQTSQITSNNVGVGMIRP